MCVILYKLYCYFMYTCSIRPYIQYTRCHRLFPDLYFPVNNKIVILVSRVSSSLEYVLQYLLLQCLPLAALIVCCL